MIDIVIVSALVLLLFRFGTTSRDESNRRFQR